MMKKLLVYNVMEFPDKVRRFNLGIQREIEAVGIAADFYVFGKDKKIESIAAYSHLIISGSEASAMDESLWTQELSQMVRDFIAAGKKVLAICYGHQFLARVICGKEHVIKMPVPEYGYSKIELKQNPLFEGISNPVVLELHYDAVVNLPDDFEVIARNDKGIQAFQYKNKDIYGVQFHPEFDQEAATFFLDEARNSDLAFPDFYRNELTDESKLAQNHLFIRNFLMM
jgi:GMP synthase (glutamine-hydrolysing)